MDKIYIDGQELLLDSFRLAHKVLLSNFSPTFIIAVWRGGVPIGIAVQELLAFHGVDSDHIAIRTSSYNSGIDKQGTEIRIYGLNYLVKNMRHDDRVLLVDDVFDTGRSLEAVIKELAERLRLNMPEDVRIAVPYYKPARRKVAFEPDFFIHKTDAWLKFPHSLEGLSENEIRQNRPGIYEIIKDYLP